MYQSRNTSTSTAAAAASSSSSSKKMSFIVVTTLLALLVSISTSDARAEAKPLNQNQVKFRRLPPKEFSAAIGSSITIECEAGGTPPPSIHWLKNGVRIPQSDQEENQLESSSGSLAAQVDEINRIALGATRSRLFIDCADYSDEAVYSCVAENAFTRISSHTKLNLIRPLPAVAAAGTENDLLAGPMEEAMELAAAAAATGAKPSVEGAADGGKSLSAVAQCLSQRGTRAIEPLRIHMWTHNVVEVMGNSVVLYCRNNANKRQQLSQQQQQSQDAADLKKPSEQQLQLHSSSDRQAASTSWTLPDDKIVGPNQKDKYEILETGDLLIKDLRWPDMGSYVCTVSDEQSSDSVSTFVYPASMKSDTNKRSAPTRLANFR